MAHAESCPICWGKGKLEDGEHKGGKTCHGCSGKGWVEVQDPEQGLYWPKTTASPSRVG